MKNAGPGKPTVGRDDDRRCRPPCWAFLLALLLTAGVAAAMALYIRLTAVPRLQICGAKLQWPDGYNPLNGTIIQNLKLNITFCWK